MALGIAIALTAIVFPDAAMQVAGDVDAVESAFRRSLPALARASSGGHLASRSRLSEFAGTSVRRMTDAKAAGISRLLLPLSCN